MKHALLTTILSMLCFQALAQYRVQVAVYGEAVPEDYFLQLGIRNMEVEKDHNDLYRYYFSATDELKAEELKAAAKEKGFQYAKVIDLKSRALQCINACAPIPLNLDQRSFKMMINFTFNHDYLSSQSRKELETLTSILQQHKTFNVKLTGHTDAIGTAQYNIGLASRRALASKNYLMSRGVSPERVKIKVYGESSPVAINRDANGNDIPLGRKFNRRVEIELVDSNNQKIEKWTEKVVIPQHLKINPQRLLQLSKPDPKTK